MLIHLSPCYTGPDTDPGPPGLSTCTRMFCCQMSEDLSTGAGDTRTCRRCAPPPPASCTPPPPHPPPQPPSHRSPGHWCWSQSLPCTSDTDHCQCDMYQHIWQPPPHPVQPEQYVKCDPNVQNTVDSHLDYVRI